MDGFQRAPLRVRLFHTLPGEGRTSMEVYARELTAALTALDAAPVIEHCQPAGRLRRATRGWPVLERFAGYVDRYVAYQWHAWRHDADVNHIVDHGYGHLAFSLDARRTVVTFHDALLPRVAAGEHPSQGYVRSAVLGHRLSLCAIARVARVITDSESSRADLLRFTDYPPERVRVVPLGVAPLFHPLAPADRPPNDAVRLLHVGHCWPYKNVETLLRLVPALRRRLDQRVVLVKAGGEFTPAQHRLIARLGIAADIEHRPRVPLADLPAVYAGADVLVQPSLYEGFGLTVLEAMACGTPVVAATAGALPEVVGEAGLLVPPTDLSALADAVVRVLTDPALRAQLRERGLVRAQRFTWERTARATYAVYREVYDESR
jgi:glycosyltransferase involved in cell wall biosynthesis